MSTVASAREHVAALRSSRDRLASLVGDLDEDALRAPSYCHGWSIDQVLSHLGSQAEAFAVLLDAALAGDPVPGAEGLPPFGDGWDAKGPLQRRDDWLAASEADVARFEGLADAEVEVLAADVLGAGLDLVGLARMRLSEQAVHTWDVEVMGAPEAAVTPSAVPLLLDGLDPLVSRTAVGGPVPFHVRVGTRHPVRDLVVEVGERVVVRTAEPDDGYDGAVDLPAEAFLRLVYGRLDADHTPEHSQSGARGLVDLRAAFPGV